MTISLRAAHPPPRGEDRRGRNDERILEIERTEIGCGPIYKFYARSAPLVGAEWDSARVLDEAPHLSPRICPLICAALCTAAIGKHGKGRWFRVEESRLSATRLCSAARYIWHEYAYPFAARSRVAKAVIIFEH